MKTDLPTPRKVELAAIALGRQGEHGLVSALAREYDVARATVYSARGAANQVLAKHFEGPAADGDEPTPASAPFTVADEAQLRRAITALRIVVPGTLRPIVQLLPILYPGVRLSYGTVQRIAVESEVLAAEFNRRADLSAARTGALDELFSQRKPVLGGIELDSGYAFCLELREHRAEKDWAEVLRVARAQGLNLEEVVSDAAGGIKAGARAAFPFVELRDDAFHLLYEIGKVLQRLERHGLGAIGREDDARRRLATAREQGKDCRGPSMKLRWAQDKCADAIELHDTFARAADQVVEALEFIDLESGRLHTTAEAEQMLRQSAAIMLELPSRWARKVGRYLDNRVPGMLHAIAELRGQLDELAQRCGAEATQLACLVVRLVRDIKHPRYRWQRTRLSRHLAGAYARLRAVAPTQADGLVSAVEHLVHLRHRASSAIEGLNAALRPFLYLHRGVSQSFLELFRAYFNLRTRNSGPYEGMSPYERLTGETVEDWLTLMGLPPSPDNA